MWGRGDGRSSEGLLISGLSAFVAGVGAADGREVSHLELGPSFLAVLFPILPGRASWGCRGGIQQLPGMRIQNVNTGIRTSQAGSLALPLVS